MIYLDHASTTPVHPKVIKIMTPFFNKSFGNPSSLYKIGRVAASAVSESRKIIANILNCHPEEIIFTSCGTESDSTAILSAININPEKKHIITTSVEHPGVLNVCKYLQSSKGYEITYLSVDNQGRINLDELKSAINEHTAIISIMWANNETGVIFPVEEASKIAASRGVLFHTDAVQAAGKIPIDLKNSLRFSNALIKVLNELTSISLLTLNISIFCFQSLDKISITASGRKQGITFPCQPDSLSCL